MFGNAKGERERGSLKRDRWEEKRDQQMGKIETVEGGYKGPRSEECSRVVRGTL